MLLQMVGVKEIKITMDEVCSHQPISLRTLEDYMIVAAHLFGSIILRVELPSIDLPPCILTELLYDNADHIVIYDVLSPGMPVPPKVHVQDYNEFNPAT